jgi:phosphoenolpyruvate carboxykinase (GTP)
MIKPNTSNTVVLQWVEDMTNLCQPDYVFWCDGSELEKESLLEDALSRGVLLRLNQEKLPDCYYHRSTVDDVARSEDRTLICTPTPEEAGPTNNWAAPAETYQKLKGLCAGGMRGRTLYVVPYLMGPLGSSLAKVGIELTDSIYVALSMRIMTRMGQVAYEHLGLGTDFNRGLHCMLKMDARDRYIAHFPQDNAVISTSSNYGGNVLLGKKCLALRIGSWLARKEGWLAEHMLILSAESPTGERTYVTARPISPCWSPRLTWPRGKFAPSATTSPGCGPGTMAASTPSILKPAISGSRREPMNEPTPMPWPRLRATRSTPTSR